MKGYYYSGGSMYHAPCAGVKSALETNPKLFEAKEKVKYVTVDTDHLEAISGIQIQPVGVSENWPWRFSSSSSPSLASNAASTLHTNY